MFQVIKRDGVLAAFCLDKISGAIVKAFNATQVQFNDDIVGLLALRVTADIQGKIKEGKVHVEDEHSFPTRRSSDLSRQVMQSLQRRLSCIGNRGRKCATCAPQF